MARREPEHDLQAMVVQWWSYKCREFGLPECLLFAVPNGSMRHKAVAGKLKAEGVRAGIPDMMLAAPNGDYHGLFIEHKIKPKKPSVEQDRVIGDLRDQGYQVAVSYSYDETVRHICSYLRGD